MPGLTGRMSTIVKAKVSKLLDRAEDPGETLDYSYEKQLELLQNVKKGIADIVTSKKRLQMQEKTMQQQVVKLDTQARQALAAGRDGQRPYGGERGGARGRGQGRGRRGGRGHVGGPAGADRGLGEGGGSTGKAEARRCENDRYRPERHPATSFVGLRG